MYGHNNLVLEQAKVPFFVKRNDEVKLPPVMSYYQIIKFIADDLGFSLNNPNEENNTYYLHGNNVDFPYDFIKYQISDDGQITQIEKDNTANLK